MKKYVFLLLTLLAFHANAQTPAQILQLKYEGFTVWVDCLNRGAVKFQYTLQADIADYPRSSSFYIDKSVPRECQQLSTSAYGLGYDRGHLVAANHMDFSATAVKQSNIMVNVLPQTVALNRGAWERTEIISDCYRDIEPLLIIGGVIWGDYLGDDYFLESHGVATPDAFWKVIIRGSGADQRAIAWIVPNSDGANSAALDQYIVSVEELEMATGEVIPVADYVKYERPSQSWMIPYGCNRS
jgi:endonuclease G, mitochondrial